MPDAVTRAIGHLRKYHSNFYYVAFEGELYECSLRGLIKKEGIEPWVGDYVQLDSIDSQSKTARVSAVEPRKNSIPRPKIANVDQALILYSLKEPAFDWHQMDRYITHVELAGLEPVLCISKVDLAQSPQDWEVIRALYAEKLGYQVFFTAIHQLDTLNGIRSATQHKISVLAGPSGSGKSSLLNALNPTLQLRVGEVSEKIERGQHTTRHVELLSLYGENESSLIADTPGFSHLKFNTVLPEQIRNVYREFKPFNAQCAFADCLHIDESGCAVLAQSELVESTRYKSYQEMLAEAREYKVILNSTSQKESLGFKQLDGKGKEAIKILRLKEKNRDASRRVARQQVSQLGLEPDPDEIDYE